MTGAEASYRIVTRLFTLLDGMLSEAFRDSELTASRLEDFRLALAAGEPLPRRYDRYISREDRELRRLARSAHELGSLFLQDAHRGMEPDQVQAYCDALAGMREAAKVLAGSEA